LRSSMNRSFSETHLALSTPPKLRTPGAKTPGSMMKSMADLYVTHTFAHMMVCIPGAHRCRPYAQVGQAAAVWQHWRRARTRSPRALCFVPNIATCAVVACRSANKHSNAVVHEHAHTHMLTHTPQQIVATPATQSVARRRHCRVCRASPHLPRSHRQRDRVSPTSYQHWRQ
jgi:hypothetical protein